MSTTEARPRRGLEQLIPVDEQTALTSVEELPLGVIDPAPDNPRRDIGDVAELAASMRELGLLQPLVVTPRQGRYLLVVGHRRYQAAVAAGLETVPAIVRELDEPQRKKAMLIENCQRVDLTPLEEARGYQGLVELGLSQREIADQVGRSQPHVSKRLSLLELPAKVQKAVDNDGITIGDAYELLKLKDHPNRLGAAFQRRGQFQGGLETTVRQQLRELEVEEKVAAARAELKEQGIRVVAWNDRVFDGMPKGAIRLDRYEARDLKLTVTGHAKKPCHAAMISPREGSVLYLCTQPANHKKAAGAKVVDVGEQEARRKERQAEKRAQLRAREKNIELGAALAKKLAAPPIELRTMRLLADLLMIELGSELGNTSFRYVDEASQTVITKKDGSISRIVHPEGTAARKLLEDRIDAAGTPEEILGVLLQALIAAKYADRKAVPASQRAGYVGALEAHWLDGTYKRVRQTVEQVAKKAGVVEKRPK